MRQLSIIATVIGILVPFAASASRAWAEKPDAAAGAPGAILSEGQAGKLKQGLSDEDKAKIFDYMQYFDTIVVTHYSGRSTLSTRTLIEKILADHPKVLDEPAVTVQVVEVADSSVNFVVRPWVKTGDYWDVYFALTEQIKIRFDAEGISIPYPQQDLHIFQEQKTD